MIFDFTMFCGNKETARNEFGEPAGGWRWLRTYQGGYKDRGRGVRNINRSVEKVEFRVDRAGLLNRGRIGADYFYKHCAPLALTDCNKARL